MPSLTIFITENVSASLRGLLTRWMLELKAGVFIGTLSGLVKEKLWKKICNNIKEGGCIMVKATKSEQRFEIRMHGYPGRIVENFEGIQLIRTPENHKELENNKSKKINIANKKDITNIEGKKKIIPKKPEKGIFSKIESLIELSESNFHYLNSDLISNNLPNSFIERYIGFFNDVEDKNNLQSFPKYGGTSSYFEYTDTRLWPIKYTKNILDIGRKILFLIQQNTKSGKIHNKYYSGKKILSLDIETTDYLPKAYEGFMNILGFSYLDLSKNNLNSNTNNQNKNNPILLIYQIFNMKRKKSLAHHLIKFAKTFIETSDIILVFNRDFDLNIINKICLDKKLELNLPNIIVDLADYYPSLKSLEKELESLNIFKRDLTKKGKYSYYYKLFKGYGKKEIMKQIEPIGTYNIIDTLTPLLMYLIYDFKGN